MPFQVREWKPYPIDENHPREDIRLKAYAEKLGFEAKTDAQGFWIEGVPYDSYIFVKGKTEIWKVLTNMIDEWRAADRVQGRLKNHRSYKDLKTALETEK